MTKTDEDRIRRMIRHAAAAALVDSSDPAADVVTLGQRLRQAGELVLAEAHDANGGPASSRAEVTASTMVARQ